MYFITDVFADNDLTPEPKMNNIPYGIDKVSRILEDITFLNSDWVITYIECEPRNQLI